MNEHTYEIDQTLQVPWPCLSFDVLQVESGGYESATCIVTGSQATLPGLNELSLYQIFRLGGNEGMEDAESADSVPTVVSSIVAHQGTVNRVRASPAVDFRRHYIATWADTGHVHIWDAHPFATDRCFSLLFTITNHQGVEGFAIDWSASSPLRLLSGDIRGNIFLTSMTQADFRAHPSPFKIQEGSVEDLQWSPSEAAVFASACTDNSMRIWDIRVKTRQHALKIGAAHTNDVNVISWNKQKTSLIISGGDDGKIKVWDLRNIRSSSVLQPLATFNWHRGAITSLEWHSVDESVFAVSSADDRITLWDLAVEMDDESSTSSLDYHTDLLDYGKLPPQLLFVHHSTRDVKELHWHPHCPGVVISTAFEGFNIFKAICV